MKPCKPSGTRPVKSAANHERRSTTVFAMPQRTSQMK